MPGSGLGLSIVRQVAERHGGVGPRRHGPSRAAPRSGSTSPARSRRRPRRFSAPVKPVRHAGWHDGAEPARRQPHGRHAATHGRPARWLDAPVRRRPAPPLTGSSPRRRTRAAPPPYRRTVRARTPRGSAGSASQTARTERRLARGRPVRAARSSPASWRRPWSWVGSAVWLAAAGFTAVDDRSGAAPSESSSAGPQSSPVVEPQGRRPAGGLGRGGRQVRAPLGRQDQRQGRSRARAPAPASSSAPTARSSPTTTSSRSPASGGEISVNFNDGTHQEGHRRRHRPAHRPRGDQGRGRLRPDAGHHRQLRRSSTSARTSSRSARRSASRPPSPAASSAP